MSKTKSGDPSSSWNDFTNMDFMRWHRRMISTEVILNENICRKLMNTTVSLKGSICNEEYEEMEQKLITGNCLLFNERKSGL
ncbi:hypothetical protein TNCV_3823621 [Trichonephila clavipes]|nr:hypothetical protein TNCV_3823621 [Trichonephila clavipes]